MQQVQQLRYLSTAFVLEQAIVDRTMHALLNENKAFD
jgi:hypothetical protein